MTPIPHPNPETWHAHPSTLAYGDLSDALVLVLALVAVAVIGGIAFWRGEHSLLRKYRRREPRASSDCGPRSRS
jgi:hypothetical protein